MMKGSIPIERPILEGIRRRLQVFLTRSRKRSHRSEPRLRIGGAKIVTNKATHKATSWRWSKMGDISFYFFRLLLSLCLFHQAERLRNVILLAIAALQRPPLWNVTQIMKLILTRDGRCPNFLVAPGLSHLLILIKVTCWSRPQTRWFRLILSLFFFLSNKIFFLLRWLEMRFVHILPLARLINHSAIAYHGKSWASSSPPSCLLSWTCKRSR